MIDQPDPADDRFTDDELRDLLRRLLHLIHGEDSAPEVKTAQRIEEAIRRRPDAG